MERAPGRGRQLARAVDDVDAPVRPGRLDLDVPVGKGEVVLLGLRPEPGGEGGVLAEVRNEAAEGHELAEQPDLLVLAQARRAREEAAVAREGDVEGPLHGVAPLQLLRHRLQERVRLVFDPLGVDRQAEPDGLVARLLEDVGADDPVGGDVDIGPGGGRSQGQLPAGRVDAQDADRAVADPLLAGQPRGDVGGQRLGGEDG